MEATVLKAVVSHLNSDPSSHISEIQQNIELETNIFAQVWMDFLKTAQMVNILKASVWHLYVCTIDYNQTSL